MNRACGVPPSGSAQSSQSLGDPVQWLVRITESRLVITAAIVLQSPAGKQTTHVSPTQYRTARPVSTFSERVTQQGAYSGKREERSHPKLEGLLPHWASVCDGFLRSDTQPAAAELREPQLAHRA